MSRFRAQIVTVLSSRRRATLAAAVLACCLGQSCDVNVPELAAGDEQVLGFAPPPPPTEPGALQAALDDISILASTTDGEEPLSVDLSVTTVSGGPFFEGVYWWDLGDGQTAEGTQVTHSFAAGTWKVMLCATLGTGLTAMTGCKEKEVTSRARPITGPDGKTTIAISGTVKSQGEGLPGVTVITSDGSGNAVTDASGYYSLRVELGWTGTLTAQVDGYAMMPTSRAFDNLPASQPGQDFTASAPSTAPEEPTSAPLTQAADHVVSGSVSLDSAGLEAVTVSAAGGVPATTTAADGSYSIAVPDGWSGTINAYKAGYAIEPSSLTLTSVVGDRPGQNFTARPASQSPVANAGPDQTVSAGGNGSVSVALNGSASFDPDGVITSWVWTENSLLLGTGPTANATLSTGLHSIRLRVTDNSGATGEDTLVVIVMGSSPYYVATNGNDAWSGRLAAPNAGQTDGPFRTLQRFAGVMAPGDTCVIRGGQYNEAVSMTRSGTAQAPITIVASPGEQPIFDGQGLKDHGLILHNAKFVTVNGLRIRNFRQHGIWLVDFADNVTIRNCTIHDCGLTGIQNRGGDDVVIEYNEVYNNTTGIFISWRDSNQNYSLRNRVRYNLAYNHGALDPESGDGLGADASLNGTFEHNVCWNNRDDGIDISIRSQDNTIAHNIALLNGYPETSDGDGNGIKVSTNGGGGHILHHNFALFNRRSGLDQDIQPAVPRNYFYNNTAYGNGQSGLMLDSGGRGDSGNNAVAKNNLLAGNDRLNIGRPDLYACCTSPLLESDYNFIADGPTHYGGSVQEGSHSRFGDPKLTSPLVTINLNVSGDIAVRWAAIRAQVVTSFTLLSGSPCTGGGVAIPGITSKTPPNMGAIE